MLILIFCVLAFLSGTGLAVGDTRANPALVWGLFTIAVASLLYLLLSALTTLASRSLNDSYDESFSGNDADSRRERADSKPAKTGRSQK